MRSSTALLLAAASACLAGCGATRHAVTATVPAARAPADGLRVLVVGPLHLQVAGARIEYGTLAAVAGHALVVVSAQSPAAASIGVAAAAHPETHFALAGASARKLHLPNLAGLVIDAGQAARLGGAVAGLAASEEAGSSGRVAWVGPREPSLADQFVRGVHDSAPGTVILRAWSADTPVDCKEAALGALARGATVVMAHRGACAAAAVAGAHEQNHPGLTISDFEVPDVAAAQVVRDAVAGVDHGGEDIVFGAASGAVAIRRLDRRISSTVAARARAAAQQLSGGLRPAG